MTDPNNSFRLSPPVLLISTQVRFTRLGLNVFLIHEDSDESIR